MLSLVALLMGTAFTVISARRILFNRRLTRYGERVQGTVVTLNRPASTLPDSADLYYPVLSFVARNGERIQTKAKVGSTSVPAWPGQLVSIVYDPLNPSVAEIDTTRGRNTPAFVSGIAVGLGMIAYAVIHIASG